MAAEDGEFDDVVAIAGFRIGQVDLRRLTAALLSGSEIAGRVRGEDQHVEILAALNLDPLGLTTPYRGVRYLDLPDVVRTTVDRPHRRPSGGRCCGS